MTDHNDFQTHLDAHPDDWEYRLVYADWLEEQGDAFCETQRWMASVKYHHHFDAREHENHRWMVFRDNPEMNNKCKWLTFKGIHGVFSMYPTRHAAEIDLHNALVKAGEIQCALIDEVAT